MAKELVKAPESLSVWESNMKELRKRQPKLGQLLDLYVSQHGHEFAHYETETPAGRWVEGLTPEPFFQPNKEPRFDWSKKSKDTPIFFQYGMGVPPYLFKSARALPKEALSVVVVEPNIALLAYTLHLTNIYLAMPGSGTLIFLTIPERISGQKLSEEELELQHARLSKGVREESLMNALNLYGVYTMALHKASTHDTEIEAMKGDFDALFNEIKEWIVLRLSMIGNSAEDTMLGLRQMALMSPWISYGYQFTSLMTPFRGRPFVIVSAGPSLDKNLEQLRDIRDKCVIVANDAVLNKMVQRGILPHIVCSLERALPTYNLFYKDFVDDYREECSNILLISQAVCAPQIFGRWPGPKILVGKAEIPVDQWFIVNTLGGQAITSGSSVAHMCHSIAVAAGASSIALIGQDLAYSDDGQSHAADVGGSWTQSNMGKIPTTHSAAYKVPGALDGEVTTSEVWLMFLRTLEGLVQSAPSPTYDCTEGGALIAGTIVKPLAEYIEEKVSSLELLPTTPHEAILAAGVMASKESRHDVLKKQFEKAHNDLNEAEAIIKETLEEMEKVSAPAISPERRMPHAIQVGHLLDQLHEKNPMFAFVTQSYVYLSSMELARTRFLDTVEAVERWRAMHEEVVSGHVAVLRFIRKWLGYAEDAVDYYVEHELPMLPPPPDEAMGMLERIDSELGDGHDQVALRMEMDSLFALIDMTQLAWPGRVLWQCANFLLKEGRSEEATVLMKTAASDFEDMEMPTEEIVAFLKDYARVLLTPDLCRVPEFSLAETVLSNAAELGGVDGDIRALRKATYYGEIPVYTDYEAIAGGKPASIRKWFNARAVAAEALADGDALKAMEAIWYAICDYGTFVPGWAASHLDWLATTMEKFFGAQDEPYKTFVDDLLKDMGSRADIIAAFPIRYSPTFVEALKQHGLTIAYKQEESQPV